MRERRFLGSGASRRLLDFVLVFVSHVTRPDMECAATTLEAQRDSIIELDPT